MSLQRQHRASHCQCREAGVLRLLPKGCACGSSGGGGGGGRKGGRKGGREEG